MTKHTIYIELDLEEGSGRIAEGSQALLAELVKVNEDKLRAACEGAADRLVDATDEAFSKAIFHAEHAQ